MCDIVIDTFIDMQRRRQAMQFAPPVVNVAPVAGGAVVGAVDPFVNFDQSLYRCVEVIVSNECNSRKYSHEATMFDRGLKFFSEYLSQIFKLVIPGQPSAVPCFK